MSADVSRRTRRCQEDQAEAPEASAAGGDDDDPEPLPVSLATVGDADDEYRQHLVFDRIEDPVRPLSEPIALGSGQLS